MELLSDVDLLPSSATNATGEGDGPSSTQCPTWKSSTLPDVEEDSAQAASSAAGASWLKLPRFVVSDIILVLKDRDEARRCKTRVRLMLVHVVDVVAVAERFAGDH